MARQPAGPDRNIGHAPLRGGREAGGGGGYTRGGPGGINSTADPNTVGGIRPGVSTNSITEYTDQAQKMLGKY